MPVVGRRGTATVSETAVCPNAYLMVEMTIAAAPPAAMVANFAGIHRQTICESWAISRLRKSIFGARGSAAVNTSCNILYK